MKANLGYSLKANKAMPRLLLFVVYSMLYLWTPAFGQTVTKQLYLSDPSQALDRVDPVATADLTLAQTAALTPTSQYLYAFRGASRTDFWRYDPAGNVWSVMASTPGTVSSGGSLATNGTLIYALRGNSSDFWSYDPATNNWSTLANTPAAVSSGAALIYANGALYTFQGGASNAFWKYTIATDSWSVLTPAAATVSWGGSLASNGTEIFALRGGGTTDFWTYSIATDTWSALAALPAAADAGGSISFDGISVYALRGGNFNNLYSYNPATDSWSALTLTPNTVFKGGSLISDGQANYALRGNASNNFWKFDGTTWSSLANTPAVTDSGAAIIKYGSTVTTTSFTQAPPLCATLKIKAGIIAVSVFTSIVYGSMPVSPNITATLRYGSNTILTLTNPAYNSANGLLSWTGTLVADFIVPASQAITLDISTSETGASFKIDYDSQTKPSRIDLPVSTYINVNSVNVYNAPYPGGIAVANVLGGGTRYIRATVTDPFGSADINSLNFSINPPGTSMPGIAVSSAGCTKIFEGTWAVPASNAIYSISATAKEGFENTVTHSNTLNIGTCIQCPPTANIDYATGNGGEPLEINVMANDTDPNNNIDSASLTITVMPKNGDVVIDQNKITYLPNGTFQGNDTLTYEICDTTLPTPLCSTAKVIITIQPTSFNTCGSAGKEKIYYMPFAETDAQIVLVKSASVALPTTNVRTIISLKVSYPAIKLIWDQWEDGYEANITTPVQSTTQVWGDGNIYNGIAPGYPTDIIPAGGNIVLDNTMPTPRVTTSIFYDGRDKLYSSSQIAVTQVCGEPSTIAVQSMKTNVSAYPTEYGQLFTLPVGQDLPSRDFQHTALFLRASQNNTAVEIDRDNDGDFETKFILNEGEVRVVDNATTPAGTQIKAGASITSDKPIALDAHFSGVDNYSCREVPVFPATWYSYTYYTPVPTTGPAVAPHDTAVVMLYNSLSRDITINWSSGQPSSGSILLKANSSYRFAMPLSASAAYKFVNPTKESFVAIEIYDSYTPGGGGNDGTTRDWAFNLISEARLTDFASVAWAPGSTDNTRNDNPIWVTPSTNTTLYVKYNGDVLNGPNLSPCGLKYDVAIPLNALNYVKIKNPSINSQSGTAVYTCNGSKIAAVYGEDAATALPGNPSWDVGSTIQPFCRDKLIIANNDYAVTLVNTPVSINVVKNDAGFLAIVDPASVTTTGLLQPMNGSTIINKDGTILYIPNPGYTGIDSFQYNVCSTPTPIVCATAMVYVTISSCPSPTGMNVISGQVFLDKNQDGVKNDGGTGISPAKIYLYVDGDCNNSVNSNELVDSAMADINGNYLFLKAPEKIIADNFDQSAGVSTCASGTDGSAPWRNDWVDAGDASSGFCVSPAQTEANTDVEIMQDSTFGYALRLDDVGRSATREFNMQYASQAFLSFSYRKASSSFATGENIFVQLSSDGSTYNTIFTIPGNSSINTSYVDVSNISINAASYNTNNKTFLRFVTNNNTDEGDFVFIDNVTMKMLQYNQCYMVGISPASLPANVSLTTAASRAISFNSSAICANTIDFGVKRISTYTVNDENSTWKDVNVSGVVIINDFDQEGNTQTFGSFLNPVTKTTIVSGANISGTDKTGTPVANAGNLTFDATGKYTFNPAATFTGTVTIPYKVCDSGSPAACDTAYLAITVDPLPAAGNSVIANNDEDITYGSAIANNLLDNDRDPKDYPFTVTLFSYDSDGDGIPDITSIPGSATVAGMDIYGNPVSNAGTLKVNADGTYTFAPAAGFTGSINASYIITNTSGAVSSASLHIDVLNDINGTQNDPPFAGDDFGYTTVNQPVMGSFISNDRDPNNDGLSFNGTSISTASFSNTIGAPIATTQGGTVQFYSDGIYKYTPPAGYTGPDLIIYTICDVATTMPQPLCADAIIHFLVGPGINITGKVWDDGNGDVIDQGATEPETNVGGTLFVSLVDTLGYVVASVPVANNGTYSFNDAAPGASYSLVLSTTPGITGNPAPAASLPSGWVNTGETRNGTIDYGAPGIIDNRVFGFTNAVNFDFGIDKLPTSIPFYIHIAQPVAGQVMTLNGGSNPPVLSGKDQEDCPSGCTLNSHNVVIDAVPSNSNLYYNGVLVTSGQLISNFDPSLFKIEFTAVTVGSQLTEFYYSFVDAAGKKDTAVALYSLNWLSILPATGLELTATRTGNNALLNWKTISEINSDYFEIERSTDGRNYTKVGSIVKAAGTSNSEKLYQASDNIQNVQSPILYYRVRLTDLGGKKAYSNVALVKLPENGAVIKVVPNPFISEITVRASLEQNGSLNVRMLDLSGRTISNSVQKITKDIPSVTIRNLNQLVKGMYLVEVTDMQSGKKTVFKVEKIN
jgi:hypothetical protein